MVDIGTGFVSSVTRGETLVQREPIPIDHRRVVAAVCCLLGSRRCGRKAQYKQTSVAPGNRCASGRDVTDRGGVAVHFASRVPCGNPAFCQPLQSPRLDGRCAVSVWLWPGDQRATAPRAQLGHAHVSQGAARAGHKRALRAPSSSDLHGTDFGDARFRDWCKPFLGADAGAGRRVLHLQRSTRGNRHVAAVPGAVRRVHGTNRDAYAAIIPAALD
jgi:hypothetical protein